MSHRIKRLEDAGVIRGYVALIAHARSGAGGVHRGTAQRTIETGELEEIVGDVPEVEQYFKISGDPDALIHFRVEAVDDLQRVVNTMRRNGKLAGAETLIVMASWQRDAR